MKCKSRKKPILAGTLAAAMAITGVTPVLASPAPDGKTNGQELASSMGMDQQWENWKADWETLKTDWTQISLTPGSDESKLNFAWYSQKKTGNVENQETSEEKTGADQTEEVALTEEADVLEVEEDEPGTSSVQEEQDGQAAVEEQQEEPVEEVTGDNQQGEQVVVEEPEQVQEETENEQTDEIAGMVEELLGDEAQTDAPKLIIGEGRNMKNAKAYIASQTDATTDTVTGTEYLSNKVTAENLKANTIYYYSYQKDDGTYSEPEAYTTKGTDKFSFIFVGDPQIGSSNELKGTDTAEFYEAQSDSVRSDAFNWEATLNAAMAKTNEQASFVVSAGDQIQTTKKKSPNKSADKSEIEYTGYLSPDVLKSLPGATTVGNHDADNANYTYHFNTPNSSELGSNGIVGGDYYFTYGDALFMMLNTQDTNVAEHKQFIEQAVAENPSCTWRIVTLHQDIYGSAEHSNEPEITNLRYQLVPYFEANDVDVVLTGHDHAYSRSQLLKGGVKTTEYSDDEFDEALDRDMDAGENPETRTEAPGNIQADSTDEADQKYLGYLNEVMDKNAVEKTDKEVAVNPEGLLYMTANSSSGSKYYDLVPRMQSYIASRWQEDVPTYSVIDLTKDTFTIRTYRTDNDEQIDKTFTIKKTKKVSVSKTSAKIATQTYTGKALKPAFEVTLNGKTLREGIDYTTTYSNNVNTGKAKVVIQGRAGYSGTKTVYFQIVPKKVSMKSVKSSAKSSVSVSYAKASGNVSGYEITYATNSKFKSAKSVRTKNTSYILKSIKRNTTCYVKVRAYKTIDGKRAYGAYSSASKVKVK